VLTRVLAAYVAGKITPLRRTPNSFRDLPDHALGGDSDGDSPIDGALLHSPTDSFGVGDGLVPANALNDSLSRATTRRSVTTQSLADFDAISRSTSNITARTTSTMRYIRIRQPCRSAKCSLVQGL